MSCGKLVFDVPKPTGPGAPKPFNNPPSNNPVHRRATYHNPTLRTISYKAQNPSSLTFRDLVILIFFIYAFLWRGFFTLQEIRSLLVVHPVGAICGTKASLLGCLWTSLWMLAFDILGMGWLAKVVPWGFVAALVVFFGEEVLGWVGGVGVGAGTEAGRR